MKPPDLNLLREQLEDRSRAARRVAEGALFRLHRALYIRSEGRVGSVLFGVPALLLTVPRRRSGTPQVVALVYASDGNDLVLAASNGGAEGNPDWLENLRHEPEASIQIGRDHRRVLAEIVERGDRRYERLWRLVNENNRGRYYHYQQETKRPIPLVVLSEPSES
jgi:F420H(2)-dependent quinone reductase